MESVLKMKKDKILLSIIVLTLILAGCSQFRQNPEEREYYQGREGVDISFEQNSPPTQLFYRGNPVEFDIAVNVENEGSSLTKGGIYLSGYDPSIIDIEEIEEDKDFFNMCNIDIGNLDFGSFRGYLQCQRFDLGVLGQPKVGVSLDGGVFITLDDLNLGNALDNLFNTDFFTSMGVDQTSVNLDTRGDGYRIDVDFESAQWDPNIGSRGRFLLSAWAPIDFTINQGRQFLLKGDNPRFPGGERETITYHGEVRQLPEGRDETTQPIMATSCYLYATYAAPEVCIDLQPYSEGEKTCRRKTHNFNSQGAPVAIKSVSQQPAGEEIMFKMKIENVGDGQVYNPLKIHKCSPYYPAPATREDTNTLVLGMVYIGDQMLECIPENHTVNLYNGQGIAKCIYKPDEENVVSNTGYTTPLVAELWYGYSETIRRNVKIQRIV